MAFYCCELHRLMFVHGKAVEIADENLQRDGDRCKCRCKLQHQRRTFTMSIAQEIDRTDAADDENTS